MGFIGGMSMLAFIFWLTRGSYRQTQDRYLAFVFLPLMGILILACIATIFDLKP